MAHGQKERAGKYHAGNPPLTLDAAQSRLEQVKTTVHEIEGRLEYSAPEDFNSGVVTHRQWMSRATKALGYWRSERDFLTQWIRSRTSLLDDPADARAGSGLGNLEGDFTSRIENALVYTQERYSPLYSASNPPTDSGAVRKRVRELRHLTTRLETLYGGLRDAAAVLHVGDEEFRRKVHPITQLAQQASEEYRYLLSIGRVMNSQEVQFLLTIIDRATASGFTLSAEEQTKLTEIRSRPTRFDA